MTKAWPPAPYRLTVGTVVVSVVSIEGFHCCGCCRGDIGSLQDFPDGCQNDFAVGDESQVVDIPYVEFEFPLP